MVDTQIATNGVTRKISYKELYERAMKNKEQREKEITELTIGIIKEILRDEILIIRDHFFSQESYITFQLKSGRMLIVFYNYEGIKSILIQKDKHKPYFYLTNGQAGRNSKQIYGRIN
jgi:hypothetical protein